MNEIAMQLVTLGQTEAAIKIQTQLEEVNKKWSELETTTNERVMAFERAHEVQRYNHDTEETRDWILEKSEALSIEDLGKDLRSVQALQRKHEGLERDLAALGERIQNLEDGAGKLAKNHPDSIDEINERKGEIYQDWEKLQKLSLARL